MINNYVDLKNWFNEKNCDYNEYENRLVLHTTSTYLNSSCFNQGYSVEFKFKDNYLYKITTREENLNITHLDIVDNGRGCIDFNLYYNDVLIDVLKTVGTY